MTSASVLIVDDEPAIRTLMSRWVESMGLDPYTAGTAEEGAETLDAVPCDLAIIDIMMPGKNGLWLASRLQRNYPQTAVILATGHSDQLQNASPPVVDFLIKPFQRERFVAAVDRGLEWRRQSVAELEWQDQLWIQLRNNVRTVQCTVEAGRASGRDEAETLLRFAAERAPDTVAHGERVARYSVAIGRELGIDPVRLVFFERAARFHDIGKIAIPEVVLTKPSPLAAGETAIMRAHVLSGAEILEATVTLRDTGPIVRASHEWFGGAGYPERLAGMAIPLGSRIIAVADAYDAMTEDRAYRERLDPASAAAELLRCAPAQFDPDMVGAFLNVLKRQ